MTWCATSRRSCGKPGTCSGVSSFEGNTYHLHRRLPAGRIATAWSIATAPFSTSPHPIRSDSGAARHCRARVLHSWNVERIRPKSLEPFNLDDVNMSGELWLAEGFTSYFARHHEADRLSSVRDFADEMGRANLTRGDEPWPPAPVAVEMSNSPVRGRSDVKRSQQLSNTSSATTLSRYGHRLASNLHCELRSDGGYAGTIHACALDLLRQGRWHPASSAMSIRRTRLTTSV